MKSSGYDLTISEQAHADIRNYIIYTIIKHQDYLAARRIRRDYEETLSYIKVIGPGARKEEILEGLDNLYSVKFRKYPVRIYYTVEGKRVIVKRVVHMKQDITGINML